MSYPFPFPGPIAPETNPRIHPEYFEPSQFDISDLVTGVTTLITTSVDHNYVIGQLVRVLIPRYYGSSRISGKEGYVIAIPAADQVEVDINSVLANPFIPNPAFGPTPPQIMAIGDINTGAINANGLQNQGTFIPGSFINISPL